LPHTSRAIGLLMARKEASIWSAVQGDDLDDGAPRRHDEGIDVDPAHRLPDRFPHPRPKSLISPVAITVVWEGRAKPLDSSAKFSGEILDCL